MDRRAWLAFAVTVLATPLATKAQPVGMARIGWIAAEPTPALDTFRATLRELGYVEGRNFRIEAVYVGEANERLPERAAELVRSKVDVIIALGTSAALAARRASAGPIVSVTGDPVTMGLVGSLAHPGGNVTGVATIPSELNGKRLEVAFEQGLAIEREMQQQLFQSEDAKEGLSAYVEKRKPNFSGKW